MKPEIHTDWRPYSQANKRYRLGRYERHWFRWKLVWFIESHGTIAGAFYWNKEFSTLKEACQYIDKLKQQELENERYRQERNQPWKLEGCN
jgi:hypothetical protein